MEPLTLEAAPQNVNVGSASHDASALCLVIILSF